MSISEIANLTSLANTTLTSMLDRMESQELIKRTPDPHNRRKTIIQLTQKAQELRSAYDAVSEQTNDVFYAGFTDEDILHFENTLRRIIKNFEEREEHDKKRNTEHH